ncbi:hypothetical protein GGX14DRAFT_702082 [Mycena pura]|uniref:Uncharacterized protein n=1 Tax=Mycena pura TaxID=153505 RepID=A0AAD6UK30_9AGAR|nr:hypothetical protein GGX14DRAFT_702082 [Mycena pura]
MPPLFTILNQVSGVCIPGVALSVLLLAAVAYLQWNPASRPHLNRVSFRLLLYALIAKRQHGPICSFTAFLGAGSLLFSACMFCCMAINLSFVLVYGLNGNKLEKYYIFGSLFLVGACNIPAWATGALGRYTTNGACWLRGPDQWQLQWLIGTKTVWVVIMTLLEVLSFVQILVFMVRTQFRVRRLRTDTGSENPGQTATEVGTLRSSLPKLPIVRYRSTIIRIGWAQPGLYPLLSCFLTITSCIADVYIISHVEITDYHKRLGILGSHRIAPFLYSAAVDDQCIDTLMYSLRALLYALLAALDPSLHRAVRALRPRAAAEPVQTMHSQPWNLSVSTLANTAPSTALHTLPVLPHDPAEADAEATVAQGKETEEDEDEAQAASIAQQI